MSKTRVSKIILSRGFLGLLLSEIEGPLIKVAVPIAKNILTPFLITTAASAFYAGIEKKIRGFGTTILTISNGKMNGIVEFVQALEDSNILLKGITRIIENKTKEQKRGFSGMLLGTPGASFLGKCYQKKKYQSWLWK